jgi:parallel beta-helix repeat protein
LTLASLVAASTVAVAGSAPPSCLVSNERTGLGSRSLQEAIDAAAAGDTLVVKGTCLGTAGISKNLTLKGVSNKPFGVATIDGNDTSSGVLAVGALDPVTVAIDNLTITHGAIGVNVGGFSGAEVDLNNTIVTDNDSGIICQTFGCTVSLIDSSVSDNAGSGMAGRTRYILLRSSVSNNGGLGIGVSRSAGFSLTDSTISGNGQGGIGMFQVGASQITRSSISDNHQGSGIALNESDISLVDSSVNDNTGGNGGGINDFAGSVSLINSTVSGNTAVYDGGGIYLASAVSSLALTDSTLSSNTASSGGGIFNNGGFVTLSGTNNFANNVPDNCVGVVGC